VIEVRKTFSFIMICFLSFLSFASEDIQEIQLNGVGITIDEAIKNGLNHAIIQAVGSILRSEITLSSTSLTDEDQMTFEELYSENIELYSKGFIVDYQVLGMSQNEGFWTVELSVLVSYEPLKDYINQSDKFFLELNGEKLARMIEVNQQKNDDFNDLLELIVNQMNFLTSCLQVDHLAFVIDSYANDYVELTVNAELKHRADYLEFFLDNFNTVFSNIEHQTRNLVIQSVKSLNGLSMYLSDIEQTKGYLPVVHTLSEVNGTRLTFESYYLLEEDFNRSIFNRQLSEFIKDRTCSVTALFLDDCGRILHKSEEKKVSDQGHLLSPQTMGMAYTSQQGGHFFFCPAILTVQSGTMKLNFEPLTFSWQIKIKTEDFLKIKNLELAIH